MLKVREYLNEGHRLFCTSTYSPSEIAKLVGVHRARVSEWRAGRSKPDEATRRAIEGALGIPARSWDAPPVMRAPVEDVAGRAPAAPEAPAAPGVDAADLDGVDLTSLGLDGLERQARKLAALEATLPPRDRLRCVEAQARVVAEHEKLRQKLQDARADFLASAEFAEDMRALASAVPGAAEQLKARLVALGVEVNLPAAPAATPPQGDPPESPEELLLELDVAAGFRLAGEHALARGHLAALGLDVHAETIARMLLGRPDVSPDVLERLDATDAARIRQAMERALAVEDVKKLGAEARAVVATLLRYLGHVGLAGEIGGA